MDCRPHLSGLMLYAACTAVAMASVPAPTDVQPPHLGEHELRILTPQLLELVRINTKWPGVPSVDSWDWVNSQQAFMPPDTSSVRVVVNGQTNTVAGVGFKRRPSYAPLLYWDLRIRNQLYLQLSSPIPAGASVLVVNDGSLWPTGMVFSATAVPLRYNPALHVNQEGYLAGWPKKATVGYYLGSLGEMLLPTNTFFIASSDTGAYVFEGTLTRRPDIGYLYSPTPYQEVWEADFSSVITPGEYQLVVPGLGASFPFRIDAGVAMNYARTYALGMYQQRSGMAVEMPFTRFTHAPDHVAPALVPTNASAPFAFAWQTVSNYASEVNADNPPQTAPGLTNFDAQLYPFVSPGPVAVSGGHFEAGDYNRVTYNGAQMVHALIFAADAFPGVGVLDNLGIPESGDGIGDVLQEAKWEADFLARMQDADGGFYYSVYPQFRQYEIDVLPENGDPQVVWPKNTATTAAVVAALAQCSASPRFRQAFPQAADQYRAKALLGWSFLTNALARFGFDGAYQKVQHFDDNFTHRDDLTWAACELYFATGDPQFQARLLEWFPDPTSYTTFRWGWRRMFGGYGNAARSYAFALASGRATAGQIQTGYRDACLNVITNYGNDLLLWSQQNAYGTSFPPLTKAYRGGGWYFSADQAFDLAVAEQCGPSAGYRDALLRNLNYEAGGNPLNVSYLTGFGWKRPRNIVDQYSLNDRRSLPKPGVSYSNIQTGFLPTWVYGWELMGLVYPADSIDVAPYPYYDRWCDDWNVSTEGSTTDTARSFAATAWLATQTPVVSQAWRSGEGYLGAPASAQPGQPITLTFSLGNVPLAGARITWEAEGQETAFGTETHTFAWAQPGNYWVEAEAHWPDGRRVFAVRTLTVSSTAPPVLSQAQKLPGGGMSFVLSGAPLAVYVIEASANFVSWNPLQTNTLPAGGSVLITVSTSGPAQFYRARTY